VLPPYTATLLVTSRHEQQGGFLLLPLDGRHPEKVSAILSIGAKSLPVTYFRSGTLMKRAAEEEGIRMQSISLGV
jgi:hypothetical protein